MNYLRSLAERTGQTFAWPQTIEDASREIVKKTPMADRRRERREDRDDLAAGRGDSARVRETELDGYGSTARWASRKESAAPAGTRWSSIA